MLYKKIIAAVCAACICAAVFCACGGSNESSEDSPASQGSSSAAGGSGSEQAENSVGDYSAAKDILSQIEDANLDGSAFYGDETFEANCEKLYGVDISQIEDGGILYASSGGLADEVSMIKTSRGEEILSERLSVRANTFENYKPEEMNKINNADIYQQGDWWILVISDNKKDIEKMLQEAKD